MQETKMQYETVDSAESLSRCLDQLRKAQAEYASYTQEQVDAIFYAAAKAANQHRIDLAEFAVQKTKSSKTTMPQNMSIIVTATPRPAA